jgi:hypothetical protein
VRDQLLAGGEAVPKTLWVLIEKNLRRCCPLEKQFNKREFLFQSNGKDEWGVYQDPNMSEIADCFWGT